jgi:hypothetical protein
LKRSQKCSMRPVASFASRILLPHKLYAFYNATTYSPNSHIA